MYTFSEIESYGISDIGLVRPNNEDVWIELPEHQFYALADGMGGHNAGEVAAKEAILELCDSIHKLFSCSQNLTLEQSKEYLRLGIFNANQWVRSLAKDHASLSGMGTTLCCLFILKNDLVYTHLGDSRIYLFRKHLKRLTEDHTISQQVLDPSSMQLRLKTVITQAIGPTSHIDPLIKSLSLENNDLVLLCSDGLSDALSDQELEALLRENPKMKECAHLLIDRAKAKGGRDNITVVLIKFKTCKEST